MPMTSPAWMGEPVGGLGVAHGGRDLTAANAGDGLRHGLHVVLEAGLRVDGEHGREALEHRLGGDDGNLGVLAGRGGRLGGHADVSVAGQHDDAVGVGGLDWPERMSAVEGFVVCHARDHDVNAERAEDTLLAGARGYGNKAELLARTRCLGGLRLVSGDLRRCGRGTPCPCCR